MSGNLITILVLTASAVLEFLKLPHEGIEFSPEVLLVLGVLSIIVATVARFLPAQGTPIPVTLKSDEGGRVRARLALALAILLLLFQAVRVFGAGSSIVAGDGPYSFGQTVDVDELVADWETNRKFPAFEAVIGCQAATGGYAAIVSLTGEFENDPITFGPTPTWSGGGADCHLTLVGVDAGDRKALATDTFVVGP